MRLVRLPSFTVPLLVVAVAGLSGQASPSVERGELLYRIYCQNCHGDGARGDGPTAEVLTVRPADLTRLRSNDEFPRERLRQVIDGREAMRGHGAARRQMPIWGLGFQELDRDGDQETEVRAKIEAVLDYLETLQRR